MVRRDKTFLVCEAFTILYVLLNPQFLGLDVWDQGVSRVGPVCAQNFTVSLVLEKTHEMGIITVPILFFL